MREKKRLEHLLATDADLARRTDDIAAYFDLAKEGERLRMNQELEQEYGLLNKKVRELREYL